MHERAEFQTLRTAYRRAWHRFVIEVGVWQASGSGNSAGSAANAAVEQAELLYRRSRNELADYMISNKSKDLNKTTRFRPLAETFSGASASVSSSHGLGCP